MFLLLRNAFSVFMLQPQHYIELPVRCQRAHTLGVASVLVIISTPALLRFGSGFNVAYQIAVTALLMWCISGTMARLVKLEIWRSWFNVCTAVLPCAVSSLYSPHSLYSSLCGIYMMVMLLRLILPALLTTRHNDITPSVVRAARAIARDGSPMCAAVGAARVGAVYLCVLGPSIGQWEGQCMPEWVVDVEGLNWTFVTTRAGLDTTSLAPDEMCLPPGLLYRIDVDRTMIRQASGS